MNMHEKGMRGASSPWVKPGAPAPLGSVGGKPGGMESGHSVHVWELTSAQGLARVRMHSSRQAYLSQGMQGMGVEKHRLTSRDERVGEGLY